MKYLYLIIPSIFLFCMLGNASAQVDDDARVWAGLTGKIELLQPLRFDITQELRIDDNLAGFEKTFTDLALRYRANKYLRLSAHYRFIIADVGADTDAQNRVAGDADVRYRLGDLGLSYRLRLQTTSTNQGRRSFVRNKLTGSYAVTNDLSPFLAFEIHYSTTASEFRQLRFYTGVEYDLTKKLTLEGYYLYRYEYNVNLPERNHILGLGASYVFHKADKGDSKKKDKGKNSDDDEVGGGDLD